MAIWQVSEQIPSGYGMIENVLRLSVEADSGAEAIEILENYGFDVIGINSVFNNIVVAERK